MAVVDAYKKKCTIIILEAKNKSIKDELSPVVASMFNDPKMGTTYPYAVISSPDQTVGYAILPYKVLYKENILKSTLATALEEFEQKKSQAIDPKEKLTFYIKNKPGFRRFFYVEEVIDENSFLASHAPGKKAKKTNINTFGSGAKRYLKRILEINESMKEEIAAAKLEELMPKLEAESWTNAKGKSLKATYVSLIDGEITLQLARTKKDTTFDLSLLDETSQARAKELASLISNAIAEASKK